MVATAIVPTLLLQVLLRLFQPSTMSPESEIVLVSLARGVNPHLALAIAQAETGNIPEREGRRDQIVSKGNYGRFQINCTTWRRPMHLESCKPLLDRHLNIRAGIAVLAYVQAIRSLSLDGPADWVAHYNEGVVISAGGPGERYAHRVKFLMRRQRVQAERRYKSFRSW
jgi:hypothetical protein